MGVKMFQQWLREELAMLKLAFQIKTCTRKAPHICRVNGPCNGWPKD